VFNSKISGACFFLIFCTTLLFILGLVTVFNVTSAEILDRFSEKNVHHALGKQLLYAGCGCVASWFLWYFGIDVFMRYSSYVFASIIGLLLLVFIPGIGQKINGAHRWIFIFGISMQPSEFVKLFLPLYMLGALEKIRTLRSFWILLVKISIPLVLILFEPDTGTVFILLATLCMLFAVMGIRWTYWVLPLAIVSTCGVIAALNMPHVVGRLKVYLDPMIDVHGRGHQPYQARIAAGSGGVWGRGLGESVQKLEYLPEARSDYIAAIFAEEFGFVGILGLIVLYLCIAMCGYIISRNVHDFRSAVLVTILTFLICFQAFLHLGVVSGLLPSKGTNLPFFSQGGSSLVANMMALTIICRIGIRKESFLL
jgi:cell division protein FtsW